MGVMATHRQATFGLSRTFWRPPSLIVYAGRSSHPNLFTAAHKDVASPAEARRCFRGS
jgi:hypothetical protein